MIDIYDEFVKIEAFLWIIVNLNPADQGQVYLEAILRLNYSAIQKYSAQLHIIIYGEKSCQKILNTDMGKIFIILICHRHSQLSGSSRFCTVI